MPRKTLEPAIPLVVKPATPEDWPVLEALFGARGACAGCWCMWWRVPRGGKLWESVKGARNRTALRRLLRAGAVHAVIAYAGDEPVGWCSFGPRESFPRIANAPSLRREVAPGTWSIVCFFVRSGWRGRGVAGALLAAATRQSFTRGAREIEGFPAVPAGSGKPVPAAFAWTGIPALFEAAGYRRLERPEGLRPIYVTRRR